MNKNIENYKKAIDKIHVDSNLKEKVLEKTKEENKNKKSIYYLRYAVSLAAVAVVALAGVTFVNRPKEDILRADEDKKIIVKEDKDEALASVNIRRFESVEELREVLKENVNLSRKDIYYESDMVLTESAQEKSANMDTLTNGVEKSESVDYSKTNNQVENVDEADIVKTDGKYIYYSKNNQIYIVDTDLNLESEIKEKDFSPQQIFINGDKLIVLGNSYRNSDIIVYDIMKEDTNSVMKEEVESVYREKALAKVYNIKDRENPKLEREIAIDGYYQDARMIENNIYFISKYNIYFYKELNELDDVDILPSYKDTIDSENSKMVNVTDIAYFEHTNNYRYSLIAGFNLDSKEEVNIETFFGAGDDIYVSENNMYVVAENYNNYWDAEDSTIYKFKLDNSTITAVAECKVDGYVNNQFSIDEYKGNLRIATTSYESSYSGRWNYDYKYSTHLTIFDKNLEKIGEIKNLIEDEEIYSVRFIGNVGYIVTFQEVDPLWVIDLSEPTNPVVKGELEIPGYSSYLHPYDETHIIGIGYNVKSNGYGGVMNDTIKISMFDVSDLKNPKELFNVSLPNNNVYSNIMYEHKALFFNKEENLIGFPVRLYSRENKTGIMLYRIDLDNNKFEKISDLVENGYGYAERAIYIGEYIYTLFYDKIVKYDMNTFEKLKSVELFSYSR